MNPKAQNAAQRNFVARVFGEDGTILADGLQPAAVCVEAVSVARELAEDQGAPVYLSDSDGGWAVQPDGAADGPHWGVWWHQYDEELDMQEIEVALEKFGFTRDGEVFRRGRLVVEFDGREMDLRVDGAFRDGWIDAADAIGSYLADALAEAGDDRTLIEWHEGTWDYTACVYGPRGDEPGRSYVRVGEDVMGRWWIDDGDDTVRVDTQGPFSTREEAESAAAALARLRDEESGA